MAKEIRTTMCIVCGNTHEAKELCPICVNQKLLGSGEAVHIGSISIVRPDFTSLLGKYTTRDGRTVRIVDENFQNGALIGIVENPYYTEAIVLYLQATGRPYWVDGKQVQRTLTYGLEIPELTKD